MLRFGFDFLEEVGGGGDSGGSGGSQTATPVGYVDQITDKNGDLYDIHDTGARSSITTLQNNTMGFNQLRYKCNDYDTSTDVFSAYMAQQSYWHNVYLKLLRTNLDGDGLNNKVVAWALVEIDHRIYDMGEETGEVWNTFRVPISFSDCFAYSSTATSGYLQVFFVFYNPMTGKWSKVSDRITIGSASDGSGDSHNVTYSELAPAGSAGPAVYTLESTCSQTGGIKFDTTQMSTITAIIADLDANKDVFVNIKFTDTTDVSGNSKPQICPARILKYDSTSLVLTWHSTAPPTASNSADLPSYEWLNQAKLFNGGSGSIVAIYRNRKKISLST